MTQLTTQPKSLQTLVSSDLVKQKFAEVLGKKANGFIASLLGVVNNNDLLVKADPKSILSAAMTAATLDLPINQNLGFAYIIPYNDRKSGTVIAQFQMGYKGFVQLAQRSGAFETINIVPVYDGDVDATVVTRLTAIITPEAPSDKIIGFAAYFKLLNGFHKHLYMTVEDLKKHGLKYSKTYKKGFGLWESDFDVMASKTVIKLLLSKYAPLTTEMQTAQLADQAIIKEDGQMEYVDNKPVTAEETAEDKENTRIKKFIEEAKTLDELKKVETYLDPENVEINELYNKKKKELEAKK